MGGEFKRQLSRRAHGKDIMVDIVEKQNEQLPPPLRTLLHRYDAQIGRAEDTGSAVYPCGRILWTEEDVIVDDTHGGGSLKRKTS